MQAQCSLRAILFSRHSIWTMKDIGRLNKKN